MYSPDVDVAQGTNMLFLVSEDGKRIEIRTVGPLEREYGFSVRVPVLVTLSLSLSLYLSIYL